MAGNKNLAAILENSWFSGFTKWRGLARRRTRNTPDAEDAVQQAILQTLEAEPSLSTDAEVDAYISTIVSRDVTRLARRKSATGLEDLDEVADESPSALQLMLGEERSAERRQMVRTVVRYMQRLPPEQRQVIELRVLRRRTVPFKEIAKMQGVAISTVHYRLQAAIEKITRSLDEEDR